MKTALLAMILLLLMALGAPALAHHKDDHDKGPGHKTEEVQAEPAPKTDPEPQPVATKDKGANTSGDFDATDPQGKTDEGGHVVGSKGKADDKNPPGQSRNDHNNGYECDGNKGIGDGGGNPAHTGCAGYTPPTEPPTETEPPVCCPTEPTDEPTVVPDPCEAFDDCKTPKPIPPSERVTPRPTPTETEPVVIIVTPTPSEDDTPTEIGGPLANTGIGGAGMLVAAALLIGLGWLLLRRK